METGQAGSTDHIYLLGNQSILEYFQFVKTRAVNRRDVDEVELAREWSEARDRIRGLEATEAGIAERPVTRMFSKDRQRIADAELNTPAARKGFRFLPHYWALVEIDHCVVFQPSVDLGYVSTIKAMLPQPPSEDDLLRVAVGQHPAPAPVHLARLADNLYSVSSDSSDLRVLDVVDLDPDVLAKHSIEGRPAAFIGIFVGLGTNFISALETHDRLVLFNGTHRAYALRDLGIRHIPCLIRKIVRDDDFDLVGASDIRKNADSLLRAPRPPIFRDYFDDRIRKIIPCTKAKRALHVQIITNYTKVSI